MIHRRRRRTASFRVTATMARFLLFFPPRFEHSRAPAFEITVRAKTPQQILSTLHQQRAELLVAGLADSELLFDRPGLVATWR